MPRSTKLADKGVRGKAAPHRRDGLVPPYPGLQFGIAKPDTSTINQMTDEAQNQCEWGDLKEHGLAAGGGYKRQD
jgi:hypothetical protein